MEKIEIDICIIGAGVVGAAVLEAITRRNPNATTLLLERHPKFGQEASSHNSEVIHAGIYYAPGSYKAVTCVRGRKLLYDFCRSNDVPFKNCGKFIVASTEDQLSGLQKIYETASANGVELERVDGRIASDRLGIPLAAALWSSTSGIVDTHALMDRLLSMAEARGSQIMYGHTFLEVAPEWDRSSQIEFTVAEPSGEKLHLSAKYLINCGGLGATRIASQFGLAEQWTTKPCRGRYFFLNSKWQNRYDTLIYPLPDPAGGLGTHLTIDLAGRGRLGPDVDWTQSDYEPDDLNLYKFDGDVDELRAQFFEAGSRFLPGLIATDLEPDYVGVRAKLFKNGIAHPEFVLEQRKNSLHLLGIESPGVTACLALAEDVVKRIHIL